MIVQLDDIFNHFDALAIEFGLEKIKTIGDAYMIAGGIPEPDDKHCYKMGLFAKGMIEEIAKINNKSDNEFSIRIGIHCGPVVAGVIGQSKFAYDLWGDTVNVASRMESSGEPGKIQVSDAYHDQTKSVFQYEERGLIDIKGKGQMQTYFLIEERI